MPEPLAYFLTWNSYGSWLPGDERGWILYERGWKLPNAALELEAQASMTEDACYLDLEQREAVQWQIAETCRIRGWELHAVNCRSNHVHVVVSANQNPKIVRNQLKAWCTRRLKELELKRQQSRPRSRFGLVSDSELQEQGEGIRERGDGVRENWWAERGSQRFINDLKGLEAAIIYVREGQDKPKH